jgi:hypothetical protein
MFSPRAVAAAEARVCDQLGLRGGLIRRPIDACWALREHLDSLRDESGTLLRPLTPEENTFILHETLLATIDYRYWSDRWATIAKETQEAAPISPRWASQELFLARMGTVEDDHAASGNPDGVLINILKARQLGISTECEVILAHRVTTQPTVRGLVAADSPEQSEYLLSMAEFVIESLPWWLKVKAVPPTVKGKILTFQTNASIRVGAGKSMRGGLADKGKSKGQLGRGKTWTTVHLSEISTWERPEQIEDSLMPGVPRRGHVFVARESTAKGRFDYWHREWNKARDGVGRYTNIFIPWYIEPDKYWLPAPEGWEPSPSTKQHAEAVELDSPKWCLGATHRLSREKLYFYEATRVSFESDGELYKFFEEYPATPEEAFQHAGRSIFPAAVLEALKGQERPPVSICAVEPLKDIAQLRDWERQVESAKARAVGA